MNWLIIGLLIDSILWSLLTIYNATVIIGALRKEDKTHPLVGKSLFIVAVLLGAVLAGLSL